MDLFALALPEDCEDIVAIFLQGKYGYHLIPSTCRQDTVKTEFLLRKTNCKAQVQVKQGTVPAAQRSLRLGPGRSLRVVPFLDQPELPRKRSGSCALPRSKRATRLRVREPNYHAAARPTANRVLSNDRRKSWLEWPGGSRTGSNGSIPERAAHALRFSSSLSAASPERYWSISTECLFLRPEQKGHQRPAQYRRGETPIAKPSLSDGVSTAAETETRHTKRG